MNNSSDEKYQEVTKKATHSLGWHTLSFGGTKLLTLITLSVLARLLPPENFGLVALATLTMDYLSIVSDLGFGAALIQRKGNIRESASVAFTVNLFANIILTILIYFIAPYAAAFFREPELTLVLRWLSLTFILKAIGSIHKITIERELNFKNRVFPDVGSSIIKAIISIGLALAGFGVWSLIVGQLVGIAISSILLWYMVPWRPRLVWDPKTAKELFSYGLSIMGINAFSAWEDNFDYLIIGRLFNTTALGIYTIAYRLPETLILNTMWVITAVLFPAFSALQDDKDSLKKGFLSTVRYVELLVVPLCFGMFVAADPLIRVAFGEQWIEAIPILQIISLYTLINSIGFHAGDVYKAIGRPDIILKIAIPMVPLRLVLLWIGAQYSLTGVAIAHLVTEIINASINFVVVKRIINVTLTEIILELKAFIGGAALIGLALPALHLTQDFSPLVRLTIVVIAGAIGYMTTIWMIERRSLVGALRMFGITYFDK
jgi:O-antigen/teichoic acid export membrane protein